MSEPLAPPLDPCGCCEPSVAPAPAPIENPPGARTLVYRVGTHPQFLAAMRIRAAGSRELRALPPQELDDPAVALMDSWAAVLDVLSFYTERVANEHYLSTATELGSLVELARAVGYERGPGRASETVLAFTLDDSPGSPVEVPIPAGTKVASLPGPGETPQTFETTTDLLARPERNALTARTSAPVPPTAGAVRLHLAGATTGLRPGDQLLLVGRDDSAATGRWALRTVHAVTVHGVTGREVTEVTWDEPLGEGRGGAELVPAAEDVRVYALRLRTALFGASAPDWRAMPDVVQDHYDQGLADALHKVGGNQQKIDPKQIVVEGPDDWPGFTVVPSGAPANTVDLDGDHPQVVPGGWLALQRGATTALYAVASASALSRSDYALSGKATRVGLACGPNVATTFANTVRTTVALGRSERLELAEAPLTGPVQGRVIELAEPLDPPVAAGQLVVVSGRWPRLVVADGVHTLVLADTTGATTDLHPGDVLVATAPAVVSADGITRTWTVRRVADDIGGTVVARPDALEVVEPPADDELAVELATVAEPPPGPVDPCLMHLVADLAGIFDRASVRVGANVVDASHGETRTEVLGSGNASVAFPRFRLSQAPLTYRVGAAGPVSSLAVHVDGVRWDEVDSLAAAGPRDRVYVTRADAGGRVTVIAGDGASGARLPTGQENVVATYRVGIGLPGRLPAGRLTMLLTRPLGVRGVTNPLPTGIAADPDPPEALRQNVRRTALTFDRVVSLTDFADFARSTPGIAKADATWRWRGDARVVHVTVAGDAGQIVDAPALDALALSIRRAGDPRQPLVVEAAELVTFDLAATMIVDARLPGRTAACVAALGTAFGFDARGLGQPVTASEVVASFQRVAGVIAVTLTRLRRTTVAGTAVENVLVAEPTELLTIRSDGIELTEAAP